MEPRKDEAHACEHDHRREARGALQSRVGRAEKPGVQTQGQQGRGHTTAQAAQPGAEKSGGVEQEPGVGFEVVPQPGLETQGQKGGNQGQNQSVMANVSEFHDAHHGIFLMHGQNEKPTNRSARQEPAVQTGSLGRNRSRRRLASPVAPRFRRLRR